MGLTLSKKSGGLGRAPAPPVPLPDVEAAAQAITEWLQQHEGAQRRPEQTGRVLALAVKLHARGQPWPTRRQVHEHLGVSLPMIDTVISQRQATGHLKVVIEVVPGNIQRRTSTVSVKYLVPCAELVAAVERACSGKKIRAARERLRRAKK
jgi:hypothetical protein